MALSRIPTYAIPTPESWPSCRASWTLEPRRAVLLIHDMQQYFLSPFAGARSPLPQVLERVAALRAVCQALEIPVIFSAQPGEQDRGERGLLWDLWGPGIIERPELADIAPELAPGPRDILLVKRRYSAFHETALESLLDAGGRDQLLISGVYGHIGCLATATDGFMRGIQPFLVGDAVADFSEEDHAATLRQIARTCGVLVSTGQALQALRQGRVRQLLAELLPEPVDVIDPDEDLSDLGLDSIRKLELLERILPPQHQYSFEQLAEAQTLRGLAALLSAKDAQPGAFSGPAVGVETHA